MDGAMASLVLTDVKPHNVLRRKYLKAKYFYAAESIISFSSEFERYFLFLGDQFVYYYPRADVYIVSKTAIAALDDTPFELQKLSEDFELQKLSEDVPRCVQGRLGGHQPRSAEYRSKLECAGGCK